MADVFFKLLLLAGLWLIAPLAGGCFWGFRVLRGLTWAPICVGLVALGVVWGAPDGQTSVWEPESAVFRLETLILAQKGALEALIGLFWLESGENPLFWQNPGFLDGLGSQIPGILSLVALWPPYLCLGLGLGGLLGSITGAGHLLSPVEVVEKNKRGSEKAERHPDPTDRPTIWRRINPLRGLTTGDGRTDGGGGEDSHLVPPEPWSLLRPYGFRYRVGPWAIFARRNPPRYRVYLVKGGIGPLFRVFGATLEAALHGSGEMTDEQRSRDRVSWSTPTTTVHGSVPASVPLYTVGYTSTHEYTADGTARPDHVHGTEGHSDQGASAPGNGAEAGPGAIPVPGTTPPSEPPSGTAIPLLHGAGGTISGGGRLRTWWGILQGAAGKARPFRQQVKAPSSTPLPATWNGSGYLGAVELWVAPAKAGKSTVAAALLHAAGTRQRTFLNRPVHGSWRTVVLAEETPDLTCYRQAQESGAVLLKSGPLTSRSLAMLPWHLAQSVWLASWLTRIDPGLPCKGLVLDSLFHWCPSAETQTDHAKAAMALLRAAATLPAPMGGPFAVRVLTHSDPDRPGRMKGPQQLFAQADFRVDVRPVPGNARPESTTRRALTFTGRYVPPLAPPGEVRYRLSGGILWPESATEVVPNVSPAHGTQIAAAQPAPPPRHHPRLEDVARLLPGPGETPRPLADVIAAALALPYPVARSTTAAVLASGSVQGGPFERVAAGSRGKLAYRLAAPAAQEDDSAAAERAA